ncbi:adenosylmethionine-8-amino-7-oxononanoate aminotransferase [Bradyrhizobium centrosematis]|nr:adenosylmethionine-8-amino-7-oxononanoate aminotransferase [Bradyrhizobium centrosematis]MCS3778033.1 adenosylmethionine-8-amino-7-oxononanoate aminotransferase [Bradyrhizobium centrosematis]
MLLISDEVVTGFGRTGAWCGARLWNVKPGMMTIAKAVTSGYFPLGATMIGDKIAEAFESDETSFGSIGHGYTYSGHPVGCAAAIAALAETKRLKLDTRAEASGAILNEALAALKQKREIVGDVRGKGLMAALELVADRGSKKALDKKRVGKIADFIYDAGVMVRVSGSNIILSPPLIITAEDARTIAHAIDHGLATG